MIVRIESQDEDFIRTRLPLPTKRKRSAPRRLLSSSSDSSDDCQEINRNMTNTDSQEPENSNQPENSSRPGNSNQMESETNIQNIPRNYQQKNKLPVKIKSKAGGVLGSSLYISNPGLVRTSVLKLITLILWFITMTRFCLVML